MKYILIIALLFNVASAQSLFGVVASDGFDADARRYLDSAGITNSSQRSAFNTFIKGWKNAGLWTKSAAIYPFMGGTSSSHKWNAKDVRDLDSAYRLTFTGSWTHNSNGITGDSLTTFATTFFNPTTVLANNNSFSMGIYNRTNNNRDMVDISAASNDAIDRAIIHTRWSDGNGYFDMFSGSTSRITASNSDARGIYILSRTSASELKSFKNGSQLGSTNTGAAGTRPNNNIEIGVAQIGAVKLFYSNRNYCFAIIFNTGLSDSEAATASSLINTLQTALGRNTY